MLTLGLANFQSIARARFVFEPGITLIGGATSSGKTAVFRALKAILLNILDICSLYTTGGATNQSNARFKTNRARAID